VTREKARLRITVRGRVQGVFFRRAAAEQARNLGINGWARNLGDGSVEIIAEGDPSSLEALLTWTHRGPPHARVDAVEAQWGTSQNQFRQFHVR
jgi:acylphosphatase